GAKDKNNPGGSAILNGGPGDDVITASDNDAFANGIFLGDAGIDTLVLADTAGDDRYTIGNDGVERFDSQGQLRAEYAANGIEQVNFEHSTGNDWITINPSPFHPFQQINVHEKHPAVNGSVTVIANGTANGDVVTVTQSYSQAKYGVVDKGKIYYYLDSVQKVTGLGPEIVTPNAVGDQLVVNTLGGNDQITVSADPLPNGFLRYQPGDVAVDGGAGDDKIFVDSINSATTVVGGAGDDTVKVAFAAGDLSAITTALTIFGGGDI